ncbi:MAG: hypothetical protein U0457_17085 [Candidatus Sericytochromatia bacterium]
MSVEGLRAGQYQSFSVKDVTNVKKEDLMKQIENNGKADIVVKDNDKTFLISGDKINKSELQGMLKGSAEAKYDMFRENSALYQMSDKKGFITEDNMKYGLGKTISKGIPMTFGKWGNEIELNAFSGAIKGQNLGFATGSPTLVSVGSKVGGFIGGAWGLAKGAFTAPIDTISEASKAYGKYHTQENYNGFHGRIETMR